MRRKWCADGVRDASDLSVPTHRSERELSDIISAATALCVFAFFRVSVQVDPAHITRRMEALKELEPFQNLLKIVPGKCHEWAEVAGMFVDLEQKKLRIEEAVTALEEVEPNYYEMKEKHQQTAQVGLSQPSEASFASCILLSLSVC